MSLKTVAPVVPETEKERIQLEKDMKKIRCEGLLVRP